MTTETYRGVRLRAIKGRGQKWGYVQTYVNGVPFYNEQGTDEAKALRGLRGYVDGAIENPEAYEAHWQPGYRPRTAPGLFRLRRVTSRAARRRGLR